MQPSNMPGGPWLSRGAAWYGVGVLYIAYTLAFVDRQIMAFLVGPIRRDFQLTDFQFSLLHGLAFVIFYSLLGLPIARLADRVDRRRLIAAGIALWSAMTTACGLANSWLTLFLARLGVGVGEAALSPAAVSILADSFPPGRRALPISMYSAGVNGGAGLASVFGGLIVGYAMAGEGVSLPLLGELRPWQYALVLVGAPGVLVALLALTIRDPGRHRDPAGAPRADKGAILRQLRAHPWPYATLMLGAALSGLANYGTFSWVPALYERQFGWSPARIGTWSGAVTFFFGTAGLLAGGALADRLARRGVAAPCHRVMVPCMLLALPAAVLLVAVHDPWWTIGCLAVMVFFQSMPIGLAQTALQGITPGALRAQVIAVYLLVTAIVSLAIGPSAVAALTDWVFHDDAAVGRSMSAVASAACLLSAVLLATGRAGYARAEQAGTSLAAQHSL